MRTKNSFIATLCLLGLAVLAIHTLTGCRSHAPHPKKYVTVNRGVHVYHTDQGLAYRGTDGFWYWYFLSGVGSDSSRNTTVPISNGSYTQVAGTNWFRSSTAPGGSKVEKEEDLTEEELNQQGAGAAPSPEEQTAVEEVAEPESVSAPETEAPAESAPSDSGSSDSGSSGGDSGGGGDGGGSD
jgi:uncharacterized membrane protein YgcG